jgi:hypothetical protein
MLIIFFCNNNTYCILKICINQWPSSRVLYLAFALEFGFLDVQPNLVIVQFAFGTEVLDRLSCGNMSDFDIFWMMGMSHSLHTMHTRHQGKRATMEPIVLSELLKSTAYHSPVFTEIKNRNRLRKMGRQFLSGSNWKCLSYPFKFRTNYGTQRSWFKLFVFLSLVSRPVVGLGW